jgi:outer membrane murein-binding lipoprotein Lpp
MDPVSAQKLLKPQMSALKTGADDCLDHATAIDKVFDDWLMYVCELHAGCVNESATTKDALASNAICLVAEQSRLDYQQAALADAKDATEKIGKTLDLASEAYKKASDSFPSG